MNWSMGLDMKFKRDKLKVYSTATKEYLENQQLIKQ
jgi:hypothetical protein